MASVGSIIGGGFNVVRERPGAVVIWGLAYVAGFVGLMLVLMLMMGGSLFALRAGEADPSAMGPAFGSMALGMLVFYLGLFLLMSILMNAVFRTVLRRDEWSGASLRLGGDEWRMFGLQIVILIASLIFSLIAGLLVTMISAMLMAATGQNMLVGILIQLVYIGFWIWIGVRICLFAPMTFHRRRFAIDEAWSLTGGSNFWTLFGAFFVVGLVFAVVFGALFFWAFGAIFAEMMQHPNDPMAMRAAFEGMNPASLFGRFALVGLVYLLAAPVSFAVWTGMQATAVREFLLDRGEVSEGEVEETGRIFE